MKKVLRFLDNYRRAWYPYKDNTGKRPWHATASIILKILDSTAKTLQYTFRIHKYSGGIGRS